MRPVTMGRTDSRASATQPGQSSTAQTISPRASPSSSVAQAGGTQGAATRPRSSIQPGNTPSERPRSWRGPHTKQTLAVWLWKPT